jgi:hypothetical protein
VAGSIGTALVLLISALLESFGTNKEKGFVRPRNGSAVCCQFEFVFIDFNSL